MSLFGLLTSAASGGVLGGILSLVTNITTRWFDVWAKDKEAKIEIARMEAMSRIKVEEFSWAAFSKSQEGANDDVVVSDKASGWVVNVGELVDCFRAFTRPALTWALMLVLVVVFFQVPAAKQAEMTDQITFGAFTSLFWWFGSRYAAKR